MNIYVDLDNTLVPLLESWLDIINSKEGTTHLVESVQKYNEDFLLDSLKYLEDGTVYDSIEPFRGAVEFLQELQKYGSVHILSASLGTVSDNKKREFCAKWFPNVPFISSTGKKENNVKDFSVLIDDCFQNTYSFVKSSNGVAIMYNNNNRYLYNTQIFRHARFYSVFTYEQILDTLKKLGRTV